MKMLYSDERKVELLYNNIYNNYHYYILNLGTHPTAYIEIPKEHFLYGKSYLDIEYIDVHGGLTYSSDSLIIGENSIIKNSWFIGWDYAHLNDYCGCFNSELNKLAKKWTTSEINEECKKVIDIIKEIK